jgi:ATP-dependent exoDNAse (exonuclease V) beta subunit
MRVLSRNYRNAPAITALANKILKTKNARFGSIDRESHYLVESQSATAGDIYCLRDTATLRQALNERTRKSTRFAVLVLRDEQKEEASRFFQTPLIFSIYEAKGLEYDNVILYNLISTEEKKFRDIAAGVSAADLEGELTYGRTKDKSDRSLEVYKFYINALYVALTRAIKNVYLVEALVAHPLLDLWGIQPTETLVALDTQESSLDEWQQEARRLELQGKQAQAEAIRNTILHKQKVPWTVLTPEQLALLQEKALHPQKKEKEARLLLFEYAIHYQHQGLLEALANLDFAPAHRPDKGQELLERGLCVQQYGERIALSGSIRRRFSHGVQSNPADDRQPFQQ